MTQEVFNRYVKKVCELFSVEQELLFKKNKRQDIVAARFLLYYLCSISPMKTVYIQRHMAKNGYIIAHSSILYGIRDVRNRVKTDEDYIEAIKELMFILK